MSYTGKNLQASEKVLLEARITWLITINNYIFIGISFIVMFGVISLGAVLLALSLIFLLRKIIIIYTNELVITNKRVVVKSGFVERHVKEAPLEKIDNVSVTQTVSGRMLKYGTVKIETTSEPRHLKYVSDANNFKNQIISIIDKKKEDIMNEQAIRQAQEMARAMSAQYSDDIDD